MFFSNRTALPLLFAVISFAPPLLHAGPLSEAIELDSATTEQAIKSQNKIDSLNEKTQQMLEKYRAITHQAESQKIYNKHLENLLISQKQEKKSLEQQLLDIETTQHAIVPLILSMLDSLEKFIQLDIPFLTAERHQRLDTLKAMVNSADITYAEQYRRILEAYQIENEYGKTIEAYRADLNLNGVVSSVDFLRLGRIGLYYQRLDGSESGYWSRELKQWQVLPSEYQNRIRTGLRIARKEAAPDLLTLPIPAVEAGQ